MCVFAIYNCISTLLYIYTISIVRIISTHLGCLFHVGRPGPGEILGLKNRQGSDLTTGFMFTCPTNLVALPGFRKQRGSFLVRPKLVCFFNEQS